MKNDQNTNHTEQNRIKPNKKRALILCVIFVNFTYEERPNFTRKTKIRMFEMTELNWNTKMKIKVR